MRVRRAKWAFPVAILAAISSSSAAQAQTAVAPAISGLSILVPLATSLTVQASVNPNGLDTTYLVQYGTTTSYGSSTASQDAGSGTGIVATTVVISGLTPGTTYHLQLDATNSAGTTSGPDMQSETTPIGSTTQAAVTTTTQPPATSHPVSSSPVRKRPTRKEATTQATGTATPLPVAETGGSSFNAVACANRSKCFAVGASGTTGPRFTPLIERWTGRSFVVTRAPEISETELSGISCGSPRFCVAVGRSGEPSSTTFVEVWDGRIWTRQVVPSPASGGNGDLLNAVSCSSANSCIAVGLVGAGTSAEAPLVEQWARGKWSVLETPNPGGAGLYSVACPVATDCWAVGDSHSFSSRPPSLIEHWNGSNWLVVPSPSPETQSLLYAVACHSNAVCFASGSGMVLKLKGLSWQLLTAANLPTTADAISCDSTKSCWFAGSGGVSLWNGRAFSTVGSFGTSDVALLGIACLSTNHCLSAGTSGTRLTSAAAYSVTP